MENKSGPKPGARDVIIGMINETGPLPYDRFMDIALYHPGYGYYRGRRKIGDDFITAPEVSAVFGGIMGRFVSRAALLPGMDRPLVVLEIGAGTGRMAGQAVSSRDLKSRVEKRDIIWVASDISYGGSYPGGKTGFSPVAADGTDPFRRIRGTVVIANEFFDALPCKVIECRGGRFGEILVSAEGKRLEEVWSGNVPPEIVRYIESAGILPVDGIRFEVSLAGEQVMKDLSRVIEAGLLVVVDYGGSSGENMARAAAGGTLRAFRSHSVMARPLEDPGEMDITVDVNFTDLEKWGEEGGFTTIYRGTQRDFLTRLGLMEDVAELSLDTHDTSGLKKYLAAKKFIVPGGHQERYRVLIMGKGLGDSPRKIKKTLGLLDEK